MLPQKMEDALNEQINREISSAYLYSSMESWFASKSLDGFAKWMNSQVKEELNHSRKIFDYIIQRNGNVKFFDIESPKCEWTTHKEIFEKTLEHEKYITSQISNLYSIAKDENDVATQVFLQWFISEQVEEENSVKKILDKINLTECSCDSIYHLDSNL
ncbi:ferritin [bacterium]|nr:ferritin [bacterium]